MCADGYLDEFDFLLAPRFGLVSVVLDSDNIDNAIHEQVHRSALEIALMECLGSQLVNRKLLLDKGIFFGRHGFYRIPFKVLDLAFYGTDPEDTF